MNLDIDIDLLYFVHKLQKKVFEFYKKVKSKFSKATFNIRKWRTNDPELCTQIHDYENCEVVNIKRHVNSEVPKYVNIVNSFNSKKILELYWDHQRDDIREMLSAKLIRKLSIL